MSSLSGAVQTLNVYQLISRRQESMKPLYVFVSVVCTTFIAILLITYFQKGRFSDHATRLSEILTSFVLYRKPLPQAGNDSTWPSHDAAVPGSTSEEPSVNDVRFPSPGQTVLPSGTNCTKVWQGDETEILRAKSHSSRPARRPPGFYDKITSNCSTYRTEAGYIEQVSEEEKAFPLAFSILLYKDVEQVERLLRAVYRPHNLYCLHSDLKASPQVQRQITALVTCLPNVFQAPRRVDVRWGTFTVLEPELICMEALLRKSRKWRYFINLTGQEFPLKTNKELVAILKAYRGANDITGRYYKEFAHRWQKAGVAPHNISVASGPVHVAASRDFVDYALHSQYARDFLQWIKRTKIPDESFFTTLNNHPRLGVPGAYTGSDDWPKRRAVSRYKLWVWGRPPCDGTWIRNVCNFGVGDVHRMVTSIFMFANKFHYDLHPSAYDCLEQWYFSRVHQEVESGKVDLDVTVYSNLDIVKHAFRPTDPALGHHDT